MARGSSTVDQVKSRTKSKPKETAEAEHRLSGRLVSTGTTMLNLGLSDTPDGGMMLGKMVNVVGDTSSGKTTLCLSVLAEASQNPALDNYELIFDDVEAANEFDLTSMFGKRLADRIKKPSKNGASDTITELQNNILNRLEKGKPFIYVLDSFDALTTDEELDRAYSQAAGKEVKGSYGMQKAKGSSQLFRIITRELDNSASLLIIISQVRENIDPMSHQKYCRTGGKALDFYAFNILWLGNIGAVKNGDRIIGHDVRIRPSKNKINGKLRVTEYQTYDSYGIDDVGSMIDFMVGEKLWENVKKEEKETSKRTASRASKDDKKVPKNAVIDAKELGMSGTRARLIKHIEEQQLQDKLRGLVTTAWLEIEEKMKPDREPKYK